MIAVEGVKKSSIRSHYQLGTLFYRLLWGPHIHHGLWYGEETIAEAQNQLVDALADLAQLKSDEKIVDIGCGMGGSSMRLARVWGCEPTGVTISSVQRTWASLASKFKSVPKRPVFICEDAEKIEFPPESFDCVWSIECTEHLFDKERFFHRAAQWLKPGGRIAVCVWFAGDESGSNPLHRRQCEEVCWRFVCPSLGTRHDYARWMTDAGLEIVHDVNWTQKVDRTWEICKQRVERFGIRHIAKLVDREQVDFIDGFEVLLDAYRSGAMRYGALVAQKPMGSGNEHGSL